MYLVHSLKFPSSCRSIFYAKYHDLLLNLAIFSPIYRLSFLPVCHFLQDLLGILKCFPIQPAILPLPLVVPEIDEGDEAEPEPVDDLETEELMRTYSSKFVPSIRYRWRRSRWLRNCPVALADGDIIPGKTEFTVALV